MWHYNISRIWRNLHRYIETDRNQISEKLLELGEVKKFLLSGGQGGGGDLPYDGEVRKLLFSGRMTFPMRGLIF